MSVGLALIIPFPSNWFPSNELSNWLVLPSHRIFPLECAAQSMIPLGKSPFVLSFPFQLPASLPLGSPSRRLILPVDISQPTFPSSDPSCWNALEWIVDPKHGFNGWTTRSGIPSFFHSPRNEGKFGVVEGVSFVGGSPPLPPHPVCHPWFLGVFWGAFWSSLVRWASLLGAGCWLKKEELNLINLRKNDGPLWVPKGSLFF